MLWIAGSLLTGWILNLFGFDNLVQTGMKEIFDVTITKSGYYFIFGLIGMLKFIAHTPKGKISEIKFGNKEKQN
jgi:choline-glycine betaine transporter